MVSGMGCDFKDFDDDGRPDIFADRPGAGRLHAVRQRGGKGLFVDQTFPSGIGAASVAHSGWSLKILDVDGDGREGHLRRRLARGRQRRALQPGGEVRGGLLPLPQPGRAAGSRTCPAAWAPTSRTPGAWRGAGGGRPRQRRHARGGRVPAERQGRALREEGRAPPQLDRARPRGHAQQPGRHRRPRPAWCCPRAARSTSTSRPPTASTPRATSACTSGWEPRPRIAYVEIAWPSGIVQRIDKPEPNQRAAHRGGGRGRAGSGPVRLARALLLLAAGAAAASAAQVKPAREAAAPLSGRHGADLKRLDDLLARGDAGAAARLVGELQPGIDADERFALDTIYVLVGRQPLRRGEGPVEPARPEAAGGAAGRLGAARRSASAASPRRSSSRACSPRAAAPGTRRCASCGRPTATASRPSTRRSCCWPPTASPSCRSTSSRRRPTASSSRASRPTRAPGCAWAPRSSCPARCGRRGAGARAGAGRDEAVGRQAHYWIGALLFEQKRYDGRQDAPATGAGARPALRRLHGEPRAPRLPRGRRPACATSLARAGRGDRPRPRRRRTWSPGCSRTGPAATTPAIQPSRAWSSKPRGSAPAQHQLALAYQRSGNAAKAREHQAIYDRLLQEQRATSLGVRGSE